MSGIMKALGIDRLSRESRQALAEEIWESLAAEGEQAPLTESQRQGLERRLAAYEANPKVGSIWEEVKARLRNRQ